eukprot:2877372-Rhodomonas_salina.1
MHFIHATRKLVVLTALLIGTNILNVKAQECPETQFTELNVKSVCTGYLYTCALFSNQRVKCFGRNTYYQSNPSASNTAPIGEAGYYYGDSLPFLSYGTSLTGLTQIACGFGHVCVLKKSTNTVYCWGDNWAYNSGSSNVYNKFPVPVSIPGTVVKIAGGSQGHTCVLTVQGNVYCWGLNEDGQLGIGNTVNKYQPQKAQFGFVAIDVAISTYCTCAADTNGLVKCFGWYRCSGSGQTNLGHTSSTLNGNLPYVDLGTNTGPVVEIYTTGTVSGAFCAVFMSRTAKCWGDGAGNVLGDGITTQHFRYGGNMGDSLPYLKPAGNSLIKSIDFGDNSIACFVTMDNRAGCWGLQTPKAESIQLFDSSWIEPVLWMVPTVGYGTSACAFTTTRKLHCWGRQYWGGADGYMIKPIPGDYIDLGTEAEIGVSTGCIQCRIGDYCPGDDTAHSCPQNHFCPGDGYAHQCTPCITDYYQLAECDTTTNTQCTQCTQCPAGTYAAVACGGLNPGQCDPCPADHYCPGDNLMHPCSTECSTYWSYMETPCQADADMHCVSYPTQHGTTCAPEDMLDRNVIVG